MKILVAGVGNIFLGDDGFGVEVVRRFAGRPVPAGVRVADFGIRGFDLACALQEPLDLVILVDAVRRGSAPGTLYLLEVEAAGEGAVDFQGHGMNPAQVLRNARAMGAVPAKVRVVGCEPESLGDPDAGATGLSAVVEAAIPGAIELIESQVTHA